ncbi:branched-chain amino acid aminotransferase [Lederbergia lenta]|uniref:branched-chain amino acid aminotransferase n=1 Tax=Lederbergia lenta TaxID=1467 RepID=UPI00203E66D1|nr:branched-chain amino acid aminotransferase [Lederbergia lenta]MCM3109544.1 branched-chain amino acid aminotransferase [Lederbergia lenta]
MLNKQMKQYIVETIEEQQNLHNKKMELYKEEKDYVVKHQLLSADNMDKVTLIEKDASSRFIDAYIERCDKETEDLIAKAAPDFLNQPITYLKTNMNEFVYLESKWFDIIDVDAISIEADDVFEIYTVMLGLKCQKKYAGLLKSYLEQNLHGEEEAKFNILFNQDDGLWNVNFSLDYINGYSEELSIGEAYRLIYQFLFKLGETIEEK